MTPHFREQGFDLITSTPCMAAPCHSHGKSNFVSSCDGNFVSSCDGNFVRSCDGNFVFAHPA